MKRKLVFFITLAVISLFSATSSRAGFLIKHPATTVATNGTTTETTAATTSEIATTITTTTEAKTHQSFFHKVFSKIGGFAKKAKVSQIAYIILSIFFLGWLAIGINDGWSGGRWILALVLYILLWLPGFVYSLIKMGKYY